MSKLSPDQLQVTSFEIPAAFVSELSITASGGEDCFSCPCITRTVTNTGAQ
jgi:hypothetical protein